MSDHFDSNRNVVRVDSARWTRWPTTSRTRHPAHQEGLSAATSESGSRLARHVRNRRLADAIDQWAFCAPLASPGCRSFYDQRRAAGDLHHQALRALGNRLVGILHGCLESSTRHDEHTAWAHRFYSSTGWPLDELEAWGV